MAGYLDTGSLLTRLHRIRKARGVIVRDLAATTGIPQAILHKIDAGKRDSLRYDELVGLCVALDVDPGAVIRDEPLDLVVHLATV